MKEFIYELIKWILAVFVIVYKLMPLSVLTCWYAWKIRNRGSPFNYRLQFEVSAFVLAINDFSDFGGEEDNTWGIPYWRKYSKNVAEMVFISG